MNNGWTSLADLTSFNRFKAHGPAMNVTQRPAVLIAGCDSTDGLAAARRCGGLGSRVLPCQVFRASWERFLVVHVSVLGSMLVIPSLYILVINILINQCDGPRESDHHENYTEQSVAKRLNKNYKSSWNIPSQTEIPLELSEPWTIQTQRSILNDKKGNFWRKRMGPYTTFKPSRCQRSAR